MTVTALAVELGVHADVQTRRDAYQHVTCPVARRRLVNDLTVMLAELAGIVGGVDAATAYGYEIDPKVEQALTDAPELLDLIRTAFADQTVYRPAVDTTGWGDGLATVSRRSRRHLTAVNR